jgi:2-phosphosulfolactate phosphatase
VKLDVLFGASTVAPSDVAGRVVAVIDVLRASTTIAVAIANGARAIVPFESSEEVILRSKSFERSEVRLAGERKMRAVPGFDFGNSPREFTRDAIEGRTVLLSTTNGTVALVAVQGARDTVVASYVNYSASLALLRAAARGGNDVTIVCAGRDRHFSLEDAACAGRFVRGIARRLPNVELNDAALTCALLDRRYGDDLARLFGDSAHGRALADAGFAEDLLVCASVDAYPVVPIYLDRQITRLGPEWER